MKSVKPLCRSAIVFLLALEGGCAALPGAGPSAGTMQKSPAVEIVNVTPADAGAQAAALAEAERGAIDHALLALDEHPNVPAFTFGPGVTLNATLWSFSPRPGVSTGPGATPLGTYAIPADGAITLPYLGRVPLAGLTLPQAQDALRERYASLGLFQRPSVVIEVGTVPQGHIVVTGAIGQPRIMPWPAAGITLAEALTASLGDGAAMLGQGGELSNHMAAIRVSVLRDDRAPVELPVAIALERKIPLQPGDRIVVRKAPAVEVTVLGGGIQNAGVLGFAEPPRLSEVLAKASGLNSNAANNHAVFVLRERQGDRPVLYNFAWNQAQGLVASHQFPLRNGDLVYVAEAPIVSIQRVINILFQVSLPAQVLK